MEFRVVYNNSHKKGDARALSSMHTFGDPTCFGALGGLMLCGDARSLPLQLTLTLSNGLTHTRHSRRMLIAARRRYDARSAT